MPRGNIFTNISTIKASESIDGKNVPCEGKLYYRGLDVEDIVDGFIKDKRFGFEETIYILLFGEMPTVKHIL